MKRKNGDPSRDAVSERNGKFPFGDSADLGLADAADRSETLLELVDAAFGIDELFLSGEEGVGVGRDAGGDDGVLDAVE